MRWVNFRKTNVSRIKLIGYLQLYVPSIAAAIFGGCSGAAAQEHADLAKQLSNPVASLVSVPFQLNYDDGIGTGNNGNRTTLNIQPVVPFTLNERWNLISRTIIPLSYQSDVVSNSSQSGVGDIVQSFFFSPSQVEIGGLIWGVGPVLLLPTGETGLTQDQFAAGLTGVVLKQQGPWTVGALANHLWSVGGTSGKTKIDATFFQPFVSYTTADAWTFALNSEATYDWERKESSVPINFTVTKLTRIGKRPVSLGGGVRYWAKSSSTGPEGWGARLIATFLFPK